MWGAQQDSQWQGRPRQDSGSPLTTSAGSAVFLFGVFACACAKVPLPGGAQKSKAQKINLLSRGGADNVVLIQEIQTIYEASTL